MEALLVTDYTDALLVIRPGNTPCGTFTDDEAAQLWVKHALPGLKLDWMIEQAAILAASAAEEPLQRHKSCTDCRSAASQGRGLRQGSAPSA